MADTLETLEIEVKHKASGASGEVDKLAESIKGLQQALSAALKDLREFADLMGKVSGKVGKALPTSGKSGGGNPLSEDLKDKIKNADRLAIAVNKAKEARESMDKAFDKGKESAAWRAREKELNAEAAAQKEIDKGKQPTPLGDQVKEYIGHANEIDLLKEKIIGLNEQMHKAFAMGDKQGAMGFRKQIIDAEKKLANLEAAPQRQAAKEAAAQAKAEEALAKQESAARAAAYAAKANDSLSASFKRLASAALKPLAPLKSFISSLKRIAFYRFIRSIIKAITQAFTEGLKNAYAFSHGISTEGHRFSQALDSMSSAGLKMKNQLGSVFISLLTAIMPIILKLISLITKVADALSQLFSAFTGGTYLKAKDVFKEWGDTAENGAKAAKEWKNQILGFDEINRLEAPDNGSGSGGASGLNPSDMFEDSPLDDWAKKIHDSLAMIETVAGGFMLGLGCILLFSGANIPLGLGLIAAGALAIRAGLQENWNSVDPKLASTLSNIMAIIGGALLAIGVVLLFACPAFSWLGLGLVVAGAAALATSVAVNWNTMPDKVGSVLKTIMTAVGGALVAIGLLLVLTGAGIPLGIGLILAGAVTLATAVGIDWNGVTETIGRALDKICGWWGRVEDAIRGAIAWLEDFIAKFRQSKEDFAANSSAFGIVDTGTYAAGGGIFSEGEMFIAREAGPEMVGTIGGHTAVANNDQIVAAIEGGVFRAMSAVMSNSGGNSGGQVAVLNINGREFARAIYADSKYVANEYGTSLILGT